jgi:tRNA-dihydrouridine synthase A
VADCVAAMKAVIEVPVTVKCRIGVDDQDEEKALDALADAVFAIGADALWVHARKAWLEGLSPKENRDIPPLNYDRVLVSNSDCRNALSASMAGSPRLRRGLNISTMLTE